MATTDRYLHSLRGVKADLNNAFQKKTLSLNKQEGEQGVSQ
jgi:hypothetical protein